ncbi:MAG: replication-associated recombination protein A [Candidatus Omnitrophica bacterium]|nr:replication-associated recombination protein A [Candidatus Omnitrophota bacterium]
MDLFGQEVRSKKIKAGAERKRVGENGVGDELTLDPHAPLASRMRPRSLEEFIGQEHLLGQGKLLKRIITADRLTSLILYGPPGSGKTTLALVISRMTGARFKSLNAVAANVQDIRTIIDEAKYFKEEKSERTILFIDEIHRFNKGQQDVLMPDVENGTLILIGSTTHNPSFSINGPLLSRSTIFELRPLTEEELVRVLKQALGDPERGFGKMKIDVEKNALEHIVKTASGDARRALNALEVGVLTTEPDTKGIVHFTRVVSEESCQRRIVYYDRDEDYHYDTASAFIKSMRGSDPDASVYWLAKMLYAGEDPRFIVRRVLILASEDIGNADPQALILASAGLQAIEFVGLPEARIILSQLVTYMALAPKSNASYLAIEEAAKDVEQDTAQEVPNHLRDKSYFGAKRLGHGEGYQYAHKFPVHYVKQEYVKRKGEYYRPTAFGYEKVHQERLKELHGTKG